MFHAKNAKNDTRKGRKVVFFAVFARIWLRGLCEE